MINMRAIHMCIFDPQDGTEKDDTSPEAVIKRIELAALLGYNYLFLEFWGMYPYEKHPYACRPYTEYTKEKIEEKLMLVDKGIWSVDEFKEWYNRKQRT
jgi:hypothetical protein